MQRPQVSAFIAASLDGFIAREDGSIDFLDCVNMPSEDYGFAEFFARIDTAILGRGTWETVNAFETWPFPGKRVTVLTHRELPSRHGESAHAGALMPLLARLHAEGARHVYLDGGGAIRQALAENLLDEMIISTIPLLLGRGRALFGGDGVASTWDLLDSRAWPSGLVRNTWRVREVPPA
jgi:dihydrofolate reductase